LRSSGEASSGRARAADQQPQPAASVLVAHGAAAGGGVTRSAGPLGVGSKLAHADQVALVVEMCGHR
jgi:hypothetical protein